LRTRCFFYHRRITVAGRNFVSIALNAIDRLTALFAKLPGVGKKSASRMAYYILEKDKSYAEMLAGEIERLHGAIKRCSQCGSFTETDPCPICADGGRDPAIICVVERPQDIRVIEESREFRGRFHVLGGLIAPLEGVSPSDLSIGKLLSRVRAPEVKEVILALNPTVEGDTTALYLQQLLKESNVEVSRLATGIPVGGDLEYSDRFTLSRSFRGRVKLLGGRES
jgi:recombination protein RecR